MVEVVSLGTTADPTKARACRDIEEFTYGLIPKVLWNFGATIIGVFDKQHPGCETPCEAQ